MHPITILLLVLVRPSLSFLDGTESSSLPKVTPISTPKKDHSSLLPSVPSKDSIILTPNPEKCGLGCDTAIVLFPGCMLKPRQYDAMARSIQDQSNGAVWIHVPSQVHGFTNPFLLGHSVRRALKEMQALGFPGTSTFVGGHSLGAAFLHSVFDVMGVDQVEGFIRLGCVASRGSEQLATVPQLTLCGDLDGLVRTSRVAEEYFHFVESRGNTKSDKLHHAVVLTEGMNHFGFVQGKATFMHDFRDLAPEITKEEAALRTASTVADFVDYHRRGDEAASKRLLAKIDCTHEYIQPLIDAMQQEGSFNTGTPCYLTDDCIDESCTVGSPWVEKVQRDFSGFATDSIGAKDQFHRSWGSNPFSKWPRRIFPRMHIDQNNQIDLETVSEPVYEKPDFFFDAGFFSNAALEIRSKFTSPQAILKSQGIDAECDVNDGACSLSNENTIQWALDHAPDRVKQRYKKRGVQLIAGSDVKQSSVTIDSQVMSFPVGVPLLGGKLYCKLLSPAKALDWMYTDSLRKQTALSKLVNEGLLSPAQLVTRVVQVLVAVPSLLSLLFDRQLKRTQESTD